MTSAASSACPSGGDGQARGERGDARGSALRYLLSNVVVRRRVRGYQSYSVVDALDSLRLNCFEFTSVDSAKKSEVDEQLDLLQRPAPPKIANGLFVVKDDVSLFDSFEPLDRHLDAGVAYVQVEFDSLIAPRLPNGDSVSDHGDLCSVVRRIVDFVNRRDSEVGVGECRIG